MSEEITIKAENPSEPGDDLIEEILDVSMNMGDPERREFLKEHYIIVRRNPHVVKSADNAP